VRRIIVIGLVLSAALGACTARPDTTGTRHAFREPACVIDGIWHPHGRANPANVCEWCQAGARRDAWTARRDGTPCDDGLDCTQDDVCQAGICWSGSPQGSPGPWAVPWGDYPSEPWTYGRDPDPARHITHEGAKIVRDEVLIGVREGTPRSDVERIAARVGGAVVGQIPRIRAYQLQLAVGTAEELEERRAALAAYPRVKLATFNWTTVGRGRAGFLPGRY
jgi:hypothetical protein